GRREDKLHLCLFTQEYTPGPLNGIGRVIHELATGLADRGHYVHVLTRGGSHDRVDLEEGVWVHRVALKEHEVPAGVEVPPHIWRYSASLTEELRRIHTYRAVDMVQFPNWDSEGIAALTDGSFRTVVGLYTPVKTVNEMFPGWITDDATRAAVTGPMIAAEKFIYTHADGLLACGPSIVQEIEERYDVRLSESRVGYVPHGLPDAADGLELCRDPDTITVLFVGRLEPRKGIDTVLTCAPALCEAFPQLRF